MRGKIIECISLIGLVVGKEKVSYFILEFRENLWFFLIYRFLCIVNFLIDELWIWMGGYFGGGGGGVKGKNDDDDVFFF